MTDYDDDDYDDDDDDEVELFEQLCDEILDVVHGHLALGPVSMDALVGLVRVGIDAAEFDDEELFGLIDELVADSEDTWRTVSGIVCLIDQFLPGRLFSHRVTNDELRRDVLDATPDLVAVDFGFAAGRDESDESAIAHWFPFQRHLGIARYGSFGGPAGWLAGVEPDALVTMQRDENALSLQIAGPIGDGDPEVAVLRSTFDSLCQPGRSVEVFELVIDVLAENPDVFRLAVPPISDLLAQAGLRVEGAWVGRTEEMFDTPATRHAEANFERLSTWYQMDDCCLAALRRVARTFEANALDHTDRPGDWPRLVADLTHGPTVAALADWVLDDADDLPNPLLDQFAALLLNDSATRAAGLYLRGLNELRRGRARRALEDLRESFSLDPSAPWSGNLLAALLGDAGEYMEALRTRRRVPGSEHDHQVEYLSRLLRPFLVSGRNDPCPCDSGRKYKQCCAARPRLSLRLRARLRVHQLFSFAVHREHRPYFTRIIDRIEESGCSSDDLSALRADMFVHDLAVVDGGLVRVYLAQRGEIIPADERAWLEAWSHERRSLFEVIEASPGSFLGRDVLRGGEVRVTTISVALQSGYESDAPTFESGQFILARVGEAEGEHMVIGSAMSVNLKNRASLISLLDGPQSVDALAGWYGSLFAPPHVTNTEGEELVVISARFIPSVDWSAAVAALDRSYGAPDGTVWHESVEVDGSSVIRASLRRDGDELIVSTNSLERFTRSRKTLGGIGFTLIDVQDSLDVDQIRSGSGAEAEPLDVSSSALPPDVADEIQDQMEDRWLADHIPLFGGLTPREALADPTRRADVLQLLKEFEARPVAGLPPYNMTRMRQKLGLMTMG